jgi:hypothetical protein
LRSESGSRASIKTASSRLRRADNGPGIPIKFPLVESFDAWAAGDQAVRPAALQYWRRVYGASDCRYRPAALRNLWPKLDNLVTYRSMVSASPVFRCAVRQAVTLASTASTAAFWPLATASKCRLKFAAPATDARQLKRYI